MEDFSLFSILISVLLSRAVYLRCVQEAAPYGTQPIHV